MLVPFVGQAYQARSLNQNAQRCVNLYMEQDTSGGKAPAVLYGTPGLRVLQTLSGQIRAMLTYGDYLYVLSGSSFYRLDKTFTPTMIGTVSTGTGEAWLASNGLQIFIVDGAFGYIHTIGAETIEKISAEGFFGSPGTAIYQDTYFITFYNSTKEFAISGNYDGLAWDATDFAVAEGTPDNIVSMASFNRELWIFKSVSIEMWVNTGAADFPFERSNNVFLEIGCSARSSVAKIDNTLMWLGRNRDGQSTIWRSSGYQPVRVSTHAIEYAISQYEDTSDAIAYVYQDQGHNFYVLNFPSAGATWVYDTATGAWHERAYFDGTNLTRHRGNCHAFFAGLHVVGDWENGKLYSLEDDTRTDDGQPIIAIRSSQTEANNLNLQYFGQFTLDYEAGVGVVTGQGSDPKWALRWSDDGGHRWSNYKFLSMGKIGEYTRRAKYNRCGSGRARVWEISTSEPVKRVILGASVDILVGNS